MDKKVIIIGAGASGIGAISACEKNNINYKVVEQSSDIGGLCGNFEINGFLFDKFVHLSFSDDVNFNKDILTDNDYLSHKPILNNFYKNLWLRHPVQDHLYNLPLKDKLQIIKDFLGKSQNHKITKIG